MEKLDHEENGPIKDYKINVVSQKFRLEEECKKIMESNQKSRQLDKSLKIVYPCMFFAFLALFSLAMHFKWGDLEELNRL